MHVTIINRKRDHKFGKGKGVCETVWERGKGREKLCNCINLQNKKLILNEYFPNIV